MMMTEEQLAPLQMVVLHEFDARQTAIGQLAQQRLLGLTPTDELAVLSLAWREELHTVCELLIDELIQQGHIVMRTPQAEDVQSFALGMTIELDAQLVRVQAASRSSCGTGVTIREVDDLARIQDAPGQELGMPIAGPALVHDLGQALRHEVVRFRAHHAQQFSLPRQQGRAINQVAQHIEGGQVLFHHHRAPPHGFQVQRRGASTHRSLLRSAQTLAHRQPWINQVV